MSANLERGFRIGNTRIDPVSGEITNPAGTFRLSREARDLLMSLADTPGETVDYKSLGKRIWKRTDVPENLLKPYVAELRDRLGDDSAKPRIIASIDDRGYKLLTKPIAPDHFESEDVSPLEMLINDLRRRRVFRVVGAYAIAAWAMIEVTSTVFPPLGLPDWAFKALVWTAGLGFPIVAVLSWTLQVTERGIVSQEPPSHLRDCIGAVPGRVIDFVIIGVLALIVGFLAYDRIVDDNEAVIIYTKQGEIALPGLKPGVIDPNSIAVLPFINLSTDPRLDYLATGLAEEVLGLLSNLRELTVPSKRASFPYRQSDLDMASIARLLRVSKVLDGDLDGKVEDLIISAKLTEAESGYRVWSQSFERRNTDLLSVRDEIAQAVVDSLQVTLSLESKYLVLQRPTQSGDAYDYYLQALGYLRRPRSQQTLDNAEALFRRALDLDPEYTLAFAGLCNVYLGKYRLDLRPEHVGPAKVACNKALEFDPNLGEVHVALGSLYRHMGQNDLSELAFQRAIVLNPKLEPAFYGIGRVYMAQDRLSEAETVFRYAVSLEPGYWGTHLALGNYYLEFGRPAEAIAPFRRVTELNPGYAMGYNNLGAAYYNSGDIDGAESAYLRSIEISPTELALSNIGVMYYNLGRLESAAPMFRHAIELSPHDYALWGRLAATNKYLPGMRDEAQQNFGTAIELAEDNLAINPNDFKTLAYIASYYANVAEKQKAIDAISRAIELGPNDPHVHYYAAHVSMIYDEHEDAIASLQDAARLGYSIGAIVNDPAFAVLRNDERFRAIADNAAHARAPPVGETS